MMASASRLARTTPWTEPAMAPTTAYSMPSADKTATASSKSRADSPGCLVLTRRSAAGEIATRDPSDGAPSSVDTAPKTRSVDFPVSASESPPVTPPLLLWQFWNAWRYSISTPATFSHLMCRRRTRASEHEHTARIARRSRQPNKPCSMATSRSSTALKTPLLAEQRPAQQRHCANRSHLAAALPADSWARPDLRANT
jgi:hypothetical protein